MKELKEGKKCRPDEPTAATQTPGIRIGASTEIRGHGGCAHSARAASVFYSGLPLMTQTILNSHRIGATVLIPYWEDSWGSKEGGW